MARKALIISVVITSLYVFFGQVFIWHDVSQTLSQLQQPQWSLPLSTLIAAQIAIYVTFGFIVFRLMMANQLMITPSLVLFLLTFFLWEVFKFSLFDLQHVVVTFLLLLIFNILILLSTILFFREDGRAGIAAIPIVIFTVFYISPWYYQLMMISLQPAG